MRVGVIVAALAVSAGILEARGPGTPGPYTAAGAIQIGGAGSFDYLNVDAANHRLYVSHGTEVVAIDTERQTIAGRIANTPGVHGIAIAPELGRAFTSNGRENTVASVDLKTLQIVDRVDSGGANPDAILYEPARKEVWVLNHTGQSASIIDAAATRLTATVPLPGTAESGASDPGLGRVFVNIEDKSTVAVIDVPSRKVMANWAVAPAEEPTGMALDARTHHLFVGGGPSLVMLDGRTGAVIASAPICGGTDATWFDPGTAYVFSSCGDGHIAVFKEDGNRLTPVQTLDTTRGARTMAVDVLTHRLYTAAVSYPAAGQGLAGQAPGPRGRGPAAVADSFHVLVFEMR
jgi:hypothetical protein